MKNEELKSAVSNILRVYRREVGRSMFVIFKTRVQKYNK